MSIKPIETVYNGYRFRSRLEARWAVFFDAIGADWQYEPEGFTLPDGSMYLPDFYVKNVFGRGAQNIWIEVKGELTEADLHKIRMFSGPETPIIIFGNLPDIKWVWYKRPLQTGERGYYELDFCHNNSEWFLNLQFSEGDYYWTEPKAFYGGGLVLDYPDDPYLCVDMERTVQAYTLAKQARFEHGERPERRAFNA